ncbi:uncharacterized protein MYCFIDRAFT_174377 [Pseudocercospora fijiensis CIRAD86]|uniref:Uncharacterized protein n=1 Tax=Pseudocercospora fijiensis (strain CIRAD86) TaxID=383855 RepID=M2ZV22_PSEFD|nr:uncharacterized protein MYCFIDRAFT_174377 [Pseudocercospora fijiensis CIRAD86]EME82849.1 hypothetical protein MYCFIDRAFT_174377 [Pseudocercospora fijiensis CIRAD86]
MSGLYTKKNPLHLYTFYLGTITIEAELSYSFWDKSGSKDSAFRLGDVTAVSCQPPPNTGTITVPE